MADTTQNASSTMPTGALATDASGNVIQYGAAPTGSTPSGTPPPTTTTPPPTNQAPPPPPTLANGQTAGGLQMPTNGANLVYDPITNSQVTPEEKAFNEQNAKNTPPPQNAGDVGDTVNKAIEQNTPIDNSQQLATIDQQLAQDPGYQQLLTDQKQYNDVVNQQQSLIQTYTNLTAKLGIPALDAQLISTKAVIDGTEDDIRTEIQKASGFATNSQVMAMASSRNTQLIKNYNNLLQTKTNAENTLNTMMGLATQDRALALQNITQKMQIDQQVASYRDKFVNAAKEAYTNVVNAVGYGGLLASLGNDPKAIAGAEYSLGLNRGELSQLVNYQQNQKNLTAIQAAGITTPFVNVNGEIQNVKSGVGYSTPEEFFKAAGVTSFDEANKKGLISNLQPSADQAQLKDIMTKYPDAGITSQDSLAQATAKLKASAIYRKSTYIAPTAAQSAAGLTQGLSTNKGMGIVAGVQVPAAIAGDVEDVLSGRNTLYNIRQTMGRTNAAAAYMAQMRASIKAVDPNFDFIASDAGGKFVSSTFYQKAVSAITSVQPNIDKAVQLSNEVSRIGIAGVDKLLQAGQMQIGNQKVANFHEAQKLIADEIGLALGQGTVSDMKLQLGYDITDPSLSPEVFASNMELVKEFIANRLQALTNQRYSSSVETGTTSTSGGTNFDSYLNDLKSLGQ